MRFTKQIIDGNVPVPVTLRKQNPTLRAIKQADLDTLKMAQQERIIELKYLDEVGFCLWSPVSYSYSQVGEQKGTSAD